LSTTNPTWTDPGSNPGLRGGRPATNRLSQNWTYVSISPNVKLTANYMFVGNRTGARRQNKAVFVAKRGGNWHYFSQKCFRHQKQQAALPNSNIIISAMVQVMTSHSARLPAITKDIPRCHVIHYNKLIKCNKLLLCCYQERFNPHAKSHGSRHPKVSFPVKVHGSETWTSPKSLKFCPLCIRCKKNAWHELITRKKVRLN
jgi:hypothetical protein